MLGFRALAKPALVSPGFVARKPLITRIPCQILRKTTGASSSFSRRYTATQAEDESGHINAGPNEGIFFLESLIVHLAMKRSVILIVC